MERLGRLEIVKELLCKTVIKCVVFQLLLKKKKKWKGVLVVSFRISVQLSSVNNIKTVSSMKIQSGSAAISLAIYLSIYLCGCLFVCAF